MGADDAVRGYRFLAQRAAAACRACSERSSGVWAAMRARVARRAFLALEAAFLALVRFPRATAARFFPISLGSIAERLPLDKRATVR